MTIKQNTTTIQTNLETVISNKLLNDCMLIDPWGDAGVTLPKIETVVMHSDSVAPVPCYCTYVETEEPVEVEEEMADEEFAE